jgi:ferrochelatase
MRYGQPSLESVLGKLAEMEEIIVFPLYPQYAESTTRSSLEEVERVAAEIGLRARLKFVAPFFAKKEFIEPSAKMIRATWEVEKPEHLLLSFHGLPVRHLHRTDRSSGGHCTKVENCCAVIGEANRDCYRAQCVATARELAKAAGLDSSQYTVSFQSRLGQSKWIEPYTDDTIRALAQRGIKRLAVATPAFVADCLETIEEIGIGGAENFRHHGGEKFIRIPCLNSDPEWVAGVAEMVKHSLQSL